MLASQLKLPLTSQEGKERSSRPQSEQPCSHTTRWQLCTLEQADPTQIQCRPGCRARCVWIFSETRCRERHVSEATASSRAERAKRHAAKKLEEMKGFLDIQSHAARLLELIGKRSVRRLDRTHYYWPTMKSHPVTFEMRLTFEEKATCRSKALQPRLQGKVTWAARQYVTWKISACLYKWQMGVKKAAFLPRHFPAKSILWRRMYF